MKKTYTMLMLILFTVTTAAQIWAQNNEADFEVILTADSTGAVITKYVGSITTVNIPATIQGMPVKEIGSGAFRGNTRITGVAIPRGITIIGDSAFFGCSALTSVTLPAGISVIGESTFAGCTRLTSITLPESLTNIRNSAFENCSSLTSITIPNTVTTIGYRAFRNTSLTSVTLPTGITFIAQELFSNCTALTSITLPAGIAIIYNSAFSGCTRLTSVTLPNRLVSIGENAFYNCNSLSSITIPNTVTSIGNSSFQSSGLTTITLPAQIITVPYRMFYGCTNLQTAIISEGVTIIGNEAFGRCTALTGVTLPSTIWKIQDSAFAGCSSLTTLTIPGSVEWIEVSGSAFSGATKLTLASQAALRRLENASEAARQQANTAGRQREIAKEIATATTITPGTQLNANLVGGGRDAGQLYRVTANLGTLTAYTSSDIDTYMRLYDSNMNEIASDDDSGSGSNARISRTVSAGTSFIRVTGYSESVTGPYTLYVEFVETVVIDITPGTQYNATLAGDGRNVGQLYRVTVNAGTLTAYTSSNIDTYMRLYDSNMNEIASDDDSGSGSNARISQTVSAGTFFIRVAGYSGSVEGPYTLNVEFRN